MKNHWMYRIVVAVVALGAACPFISNETGLTAWGQGPAAVKSADGIRHITGPEKSIRSALAGGATLQVYIIPAPEGGTSSNYPPGTSIVDQELRAPGGTAFTAMFNVKFEDWDQDGDQVPRLEAFQVKISQTDFEGNNANPPESGCDLTYPAVACPGAGQAGDAFCADALEQGSRCISELCEPVFFNRTRADWAFLGLEPNVIVGVDRSASNGLRLGATSADPETQVIDNHLLYYGGTLALDVPACASSTYTISIIDPGSETFFLDEGPGTGNSIPVLAYHSAHLTFPVPPDPTTPDPSGLAKSRFISFELPATSSEESALRVRLTSLHHVIPPYAGGPSIPFTAMEGQVRWVGPPALYVESSSDPTSFQAAQLQCEPHYQDWSTVGLLHVTGSAIVPSSTYEVENVAASCMGMESTCIAVSAPLEIATTQWADVVAPFNPPDLSEQPDFSDVGALVDKFKSIPGAPIKARALLAGSDGFGNINIAPDFGFNHIAACVDAFRGLAYPYMIQPCP